MLLVSSATRATSAVVGPTAAVADPTAAVADPASAVADPVPRTTADGPSSDVARRQAGKTGRVREVHDQAVVDNRWGCIAIWPRDSGHPSDYAHTRRPREV